MTSDETTGAAPRAPRLAIASLTSLGIVFGDLGTSPLYTLQTVVQAMGGHFTPESALGVLSLIVWTLIITVSVKYCLMVMRADNHGEGGILALMSLVGPRSLQGRRRWILFMGLLGAALIYGDGVITPAISVLSALEGVDVVAPRLQPYVMPVAVVILAALFLTQRLGTSLIGKAFGPIMLLWFVVIAVLGACGVVQHPVVLTAIDPRHAIRLLAHAGPAAPFVLGGVFLCITGGEALYADMGHIGRGPIRLSWYGVVLPALLLSYAGQTALLMAKGSVSGNPFFQTRPGLVGLSAGRPGDAGDDHRQPGDHHRFVLDDPPGHAARLAAGRENSPDIGQGLWPDLCAGHQLADDARDVGITVAFRSSDHLAGAYGTAVSTTMMLTTCLLFEAMRRTWSWPLLMAVLVAGRS